MLAPEMWEIYAGDELRPDFLRHTVEPGSSGMDLSPGRRVNYFKFQR